MRLWVMFLGVFALLGCGGDSGDGPQDLLQGDWSYEDDDYECANVLNVTGDVFELKKICNLDDGTIAVVIHEGRFMATDTRITFDLLGSSCESPDIADSARYFASKSELRLTYPNGVEVYERQPNPSGSSGGGKAKFGCFDDDGEFVERAFEKLQLTAP